MERVRRRPGRRAYLLITAFAALLVLFPFLFWYQTWFGRRLSDAQITRYLNEPEKPRHAQHALVQIGERIMRRDPAVRQWYPKVAELSASPVLELRQTSAWIMGQDHTYMPFHDALLKLLKDPAPMVRRNSALALSNFGDKAAHAELLAMLETHNVPSPTDGAVHYRLRADEYVNPGTLIARIGETEVRSPLPGEVLALTRAEGAAVKTGDPLAEISPDKDHAWEALRALVKLGEPEDLEIVRRYARGAPGMPDRIRQQAQLTAQAIEGRAK